MSNTQKLRDALKIDAMYQEKLNNSLGTMLSNKNSDIKRIYISGKITGLDLLDCEIAFRLTKINVAQAYSIKLDQVVQPFEIKPFLGIKMWLFHLINDLIEIRKCSHVFFMHNWMDSRGAVIEYYFAKFVFKKKIIVE